MKIKAITFFAMLSFAASAWGLTPEEALERFVDRQPRMARELSGKGGNSFKLALRGDGDVFYAYNSTDGFIILDSEEGGLIGYGDSPFDTEDMAPAMAALLQAYANSPLGVSAAVDPHEDIAPMVTARWDQDVPYNMDCPLLEGQRSMTGCLATAVAQVLYHPSNRPQGSGRYEYVWQSGNKKLSFDYDSHPFDYEAMLDCYDGEYSEAAGAAVANLMYAVGVACQMNYHPSGSGAPDMAAGQGLVRNLGCDRSLRVENRDFYTDREWDEMIYGQLASGRPMVYTGASKDVGHAFVCDGYERQEDRNYYHINWGWSGNGDGFFELSRLNPEQLGIGGGNSMNGFNMMQSAILNIKPDEGTEQSQIDFWQYGTLVPDEMTAKRRGRVNMRFTGNSYFGGGAVVNGCIETVTAVIGFKYTDMSHGTSEYQELSDRMTFGYGSGFNEFEMPCQLFPEKDGTYLCKLALRVNDVWYDVREELASRGDLTVTLAGKDVSFGFTDTGVRLHADFVDFPGYIVKDEPAQLKIIFTAGKENVATDVTPAIISNGGKVLWTQTTKRLELEYGESGELEWNEPFTPATRRGTYLLTLVDGNGEYLISPFKINILPKGAGVGSVTDLVEEGAEYFTIDGLPLRGEPEPGRIVIRRAGGRTDKIVIGR